ncbi:MAG TPA: MFS transporter [Bacteroidota bacterium]
MSRNRSLVLLVFGIFFIISFMTNVIGVIIPDLITGLSLSLTLAGLFPFSFFIAYALLSIPAGFLVERYGEKRVLLFSYLLQVVGALGFALFPTLEVALPGVFLIGAGMAVIQVAVNPLLRVAGGEEHFAFNAVLAQIMFGVSSFLSAHVYTELVAHPGFFSAVTPPGQPYVSLYWVFALLAVMMFALVSMLRFPRVDKTEGEKAGAWTTYGELLRSKTVLLFFVGIFAYVGTEQGITDWMSKFLSTYYGYDPQTVGASAVGWFWGLMTLGCLAGLVLLKLFDSRYVLVGAVLLAMAILSVALFGPAEAALWAFPACGIAASVMWSIVFSLALNSVERHHGSFAGILCTGIAGGALVPLLIGWLGDLVGLRLALCFLYLTLAYLFFIALWAKPLIPNATRRSTARQKSEAAGGRT